ncbi:hypothetical protein [Anaerobiospirillum sp. NML120449]|uniref:hypothetical protein n=1 Tax=Anaerobiospirillum sp. NML120449 TaxID=2932817 RepID=UPI001FF25DC4|nr:hypothetical protein [Anaerobiospirillum sp. NML120449]MCK0525827.1 hypothetical protein [Anaerobiospirillum sp. NML120449]
MNDEQLSSVLDQIMQGSPGCDAAAADSISDLQASSDNSPASDAASEQDTAPTAANACSDAPAR